MLESAKIIGSNLIDVIAPPRCMGCLRVGDWLCDEWFRELKQTPLVCVACRKQQPRGKTCRECRRLMSITGVISVGKYESPLLRRGIHWLKFKGVKGVAKPLASLMISRLAVIAPLKQLQYDAALVPMPLYKRRLSERGFNQSLELCDIIGEALNIPVYDIVERSKKTWTQAKLPDSLRNNNVKDAFKIKTRMSVKPKLIIVDDVTTSGSTLEAVAKLLWAQGVREVWGLTVARG